MPNIKHFFDERQKIDFNALCRESVKEKNYDSYKLYGDLKMGMLVAIFVMVQKFKSDGVCI